MCVYVGVVVVVEWFWYEGCDFVLFVGGVFDDVFEF